MQMLRRMQQCEARLTLRLKPSAGRQYQAIKQNSGFAGGGLSEASAALRSERRPGRADRTSAKGRPRQGRRVRTVRRPQGMTKAPRAAWREGSRTPGLLRGGRPPLDASARSGKLKLPSAWRAKPPSVPARCRAKPAQCQPAAMRNLTPARRQAKPAPARC
jgi:hypothetical protein